MASILDDVCDTETRTKNGGDTWCEDDDSDSDSRNTRIRGIAKAIIIACGVVLVIIIIASVQRRQGEHFSPSLEEAGWVLITRDGCPHCEDQLKILGGTYGKKVRCAEDGTQIESTAGKLPFECQDAPGFPYWYNVKTDKNRVGCQSKKKLEEMLDL